MADKERKAELERLSPLYLQSLCLGAGLDASGSKAKLIGRLLKSEGQVSDEPAEPEPSEPSEPVGSVEPAEEQPSEPED